ncbi:MAG: SCO family protein, partial [Bacteroidia bacterium]
MKQYLKVLIIGTILIGPLAWGLLWKYSKTSYKKLPVMGTVEMTGDTTPYVVPNFSFISQSGDTITQKNFENKIYVANFFFATCPDVCPKMNRNLHLVYEKFKKDPKIKFISHTVHPEHDSVEVLAEYAKKLKVDNTKWYFVTGRKKEIYEIAAEGYKAITVEGDKPAKFIHSEKLILVDKEKHIRGIYDSQDYKDVLRLQDDIIIVLKEYDDK